MKSGTLSLRVSSPIWRQTQRREELQQMLKRHPKAFDQIALFTSFTHPPLTESDIRQIASEAKSIMPEFRELGYSVGINILSTVGHHEENLKHSLDEPWQRMMDINGAVSLGVYCPLDPEHQGYVRRTYRAIAEADPEFIWVDDDVRFEGHMPIGYCCFCDRCLQDFSEQVGWQVTRENLRAAFDSSDTDSALTVRNAWLASNNQKFQALMALVRASVDSVRLSLPVGLMCGESYYNGCGYPEWLEELSKGASRPAMLRPGGGFYFEDKPLEMLYKAQSIGRQISEVPACISDIQSEIECFPYARLNKSVKLTCQEAAVYIANGCTGTAFNIMGSLGAPIGEFEPFLEGIERYRDFYEIASDTFGRSDCLGIWQFSHRHALAADALGGNWLTGAKDLPTAGHLAGISAVGLPVANSSRNATVTMLTGSAVRILSKLEIEKLLSGAVVMDGSAAECLLDMGFAELLGFRVESKREDDVVEQLTDDPINHGFVGWHRDCRQSFKFWAETAYLLEPVDEAARITSIAVDFALEGNAPLSGLFENRLGGRIAIFGYFPWSFAGSLVRTTQLKRTALWLSDSRLPGYIESYHKCAIWCRIKQNGAPSAFVYNVTFDPAKELVVVLKNGPESAYLHRPEREPEPLQSQGSVDGYSLYVLPELGSWEMAIIC